MRINNWTLFLVLGFIVTMTALNILAALAKVPSQTLAIGNGLGLIAAVLYYMSRASNGTPPAGPKP